MNPLRTRTFAVALTALLTPTPTLAQDPDRPQGSDPTLQEWQGPLGAKPPPRPLRRP